MKKYREQLDKFCARDGYTRSRVGLAAGYNKNYVSNVISGKISPTIDALEALADELNVPLAVLLSGDDVDPLTTEIVAKMQLIDESGKRAVSALVNTLSSDHDPT